MKSGSTTKIRSWLIFLFFLGAAIFVTWPLLPNIASSVYGKTGDPIGTVWSFKWFKETALLGKGSPWHYFGAAYPYGLRTSMPPVFMPFVLPSLIPRGEAIAYNLIVLLGIALNGFVMFLLGRKLYKRNIAAIGMGLIYMCCPYALTRAKYHLSLAQIFVFPLLLYALLCLKRNPSTANKVKVFLVLLLAFNIHPYYAFMSVLMLAILFIFFILRKLSRGSAVLKKDWPLIKACILLAALALIVTIPISYIQIIASSNGLSIFKRPEGDLYTYAGQAWNYYVPSPNSLFFGAASQSFIKGKILSTNIEEFVLFLGYTNMGLAFIGMFFWFTRKRIRTAGRLSEELERSGGWAIPFAVICAIIFFVWSLPPTIKLGNFTLYLPAWVAYKIVPTIRVYARFGVIVFFCVTLLSGACLAMMDKALSSRKALLRNILLALLIVLLVSEFVEVTHNPTQVIYDQQPIYTDVTNLPDEAVIVEYPFVASDEAYNYQYLWKQLFHGKQLLNGYGLGTEGESLRCSVLNILDQRTPGLLSYMGAEYISLHKDFYEKGSEYSYPRSGLDLSNLPAGFEIVSQNSETALLKITTQRPDKVIIYEPKFSMAITRDFGNGWWLGAERKWAIKIDSVNDCIVDIGFSILSARGNRNLRVDLGDSGVVDYQIGEDTTRIQIPKVSLSKGINMIYLSTEEEPTPYNEIFGGRDVKGICFAMSFWDLK